MFNIGIVSETLVQQHYLKHAIESSHYHVDHCLLVDGLIDGLDELKQKTAAMDAWVIDVDIDRMDEQQGLVFQNWLYSVDKPVIFSEGNTYNAAEADFISWSRQLKAKLLHLEGHRQLESHQKIKARHVWVLAASTGGPEAVKRFLDQVPIQLDVCFVYAQHIDQTQNRVLSDAIARDSAYTSVLASHGEVLCSDTVVVIPADHQIELQQNGSLVLYIDRQWRGIYKPSIDQVVSNIANVYGCYGGVIFFTGMGSDGVMGCRLMSLHGGQAWAQSASSCVAPSMPQETINTGYVNKIDTPENLAIHLKTLLTKLNHQIDDNAQTVDPASSEQYHE